jgi:hypothetical protein
MSALGQSRPNGAIRATSAFPPIATGQRTSRLVRLVPKAEVADASRSEKICSSRNGRLGLRESHRGIWLPLVKPDEGLAAIWPVRLALLIVSVLSLRAQSQVRLFLVAPTGRQTHVRLPGRKRLLEMRSRRTSRYRVRSNEIRRCWLARWRIAATNLGHAPARRCRKARIENS